MFTRYQLRWLSLALTLALLTGCLGGSIAQQLARSIAVQGADKITSDAFEAQQRKDEEARRNVVLKDTVPDQYWIAFANSAFLPLQASQEPLPADNASAQKKAEAPQMQVTRFVRVELWNLLIGEEKHLVLDQARHQPAASSYPADQWQNWQVATGALEGEKDKPITFLIPPGFGKIHSGELTLVEMAALGDFNVARYPAK